MFPINDMPPIHHFLGGHNIRYEEAQNELRIAYTATVEMVNPKNTVEGGMICAMLDDVMGVLAYVATNEKPVSTINLSMDFLRPCLVGEVETRAYFVKQGKRVLNIASEAWQDGKLLVTCQAAFLLL